jgi:hypothetical protein
VDRPVTRNRALTCRPTQDSSLDTFRLEYLLPPVVLITLIFNYGYNFRELSWAFSIWLESVAILPQLFMLQRTGEAETITTHYLAALGLYRGLYIPNWMYRWVDFLAASWNKAWDYAAWISVFDETSHRRKWTEARHWDQLRSTLFTFRRPALTDRYFTEGAFDPIAVFAGLVQTAIYADFGYIVCSSLSLPCSTISSSYSSRMTPLSTVHSSIPWHLCWPLVRYESPSRSEIRVARIKLAKELGSWCSLRLCIGLELA